MPDRGVMCALTMLALAITQLSCDQKSQLAVVEDVPTTEDSSMKAARDMFMKYGGSHWGMEREGILETYESFGVSAAQEEVWLAEYRQLLLARLAKQPTNADTVHDFCSSIDDHRDFEAILSLVAFAEESLDELDSFSKIRYAEELFSAMSGQQAPMDPTVRERVRNVVRLLLESAISSPVSVAAYYREQYPEIDDMYSDEALLKRASKALALLNE